MTVDNGRTSTFQYVDGGALAAPVAAVAVLVCIAATQRAMRAPRPG
ncbi:hypothetical protein ACF08M_15305 [Streptomyces sp. NPDC015032]